MHYIDREVKIWGFSFGDLVLSIVERYLIQCPLFRVSVKRDSTVCGKTLQRDRVMSEDTRGLKSCNRQNLSFRTFWSISFDNAPMPGFPRAGYILKSAKLKLLICINNRIYD